MQKTKNTLRQLLLTTVVFALTVSHGQTKNNEDIFSFIENSSDSSSLKFIQTFQYKSKKGDDIVSLYQTIKKQAQDKGANCFKFKSFSRDSLGTMTLTLATYYGNDTFLTTNHNNHEKNSVYIISDGKFGNDMYSFKIDGVKKIIKSGTYYKCTINKGQKVKINKGGFFGTTVTIVWEENKLSKFFSLSGFGLANMPFGVNPYPTYYGGPGMSVAFTSGKIKSVDRTIGLLLTMILRGVL